MSFENRYRKHKTFIENRWQPIDVKVILEEDPEKKISIIREAKKRAANEIQDQDELLAFLEFLEGQLSWNQTSLDQNGSANAQGPVQRNETLNTDESTQEGQYTGKTEPEKINWMGTQTQLAYLVRLLIEKRFLEHGEHWKMIADHYTVKGKQIGNQQIATAIGNVENYNKESKPIKAETLESIVKEISSLKD